MTALVERDGELAFLAGALAESRRGHGALVLVTGPIGIGRSALLHAVGAVAVADGMAVLRAESAALEQEFGLGVARQLLGTVVATATPERRRRWRACGADLAPSALADDSPLLDVPPPAGPLNALQHSLCALVTDLAADTPLLLLIDDVQWTDPQSLSWLTCLARRLDRLPVVMVATVLDGDRAGDRPMIRELAALASRTLRPAPLSRGAVAAAVTERRTRTDSSDDIRAAISRTQAETGGNPLLLRAALAESPDLPAVREKLAAALARQDESVRAYAMTAAIIGGDVEQHLIGRLAGLDVVGTNQARRVLGRLGLLLDREQPALARRCLREIVEETMPPDEYERLHLAAAVMLHAYGYPAERTAACLLSVRTAPVEWTTEVLRTAADAAIRRDDVAAAAGYLRRALLHHPTGDTERARLLVELATAERTLDPAAAVRHMSQAVALLPTMRERAAAVVRLPPTVFGCASRRLDEQVAELAAELGDPDRRTGAEHELALRLEARLRYVRHDDRTELIAAEQRLRAMGPQPKLGSWAERELMSVLLYTSTLGTGRSATEVSAIANRLVALEPVTPLHLHTTLPLLLACSVAAETTLDVSSWLDSTIELAQRQNSGVDQLLVLSARALLALRAGRIAQAVRFTELACDMVPGGMFDTGQLASVALVSVAIAAADPELSRRVLAVCPAYDSEPGSLHAWAVRQLLSAAMTVRQNPRAALDQIEDSGRRLDRAGWCNPSLFTWRTWAANLHMRLGEPERAARMIADEYELATTWGAPATLGRTLRVRAGMRSGPARVAGLRDAVDLLLVSADQLELAKGLVSLGSALLANGGGTAGVGSVAVGSAEEHLRHGLLLAEECGSARVAERARSLLATFGVRTAPATGDLTDAERRIAEMAIAGQTNQDIAEEFGISRRAVEKHLTNCYRKLDILGRADLGAALRRLAGR
jgi:DNA-binding CsgD family transcriptional regulator